MTRVNINNLGLIPLAGVCSYEDACKIGYDIDHNVNLLRRYLYSESQLTKIFAAHISNTPEWEVKGAFGLHIWLDAEHSAALRKRVTEMREPPLHLDKVPDAQLEAFFGEVIRAETTLELLVGIYRVAKREFVRSLKKHLLETNPLVDQPTCRALKLILVEEEEMISWGEAAIEALIRTEEDQQAALAWQKHLESFLYAAGGISGDLAKPTEWQLAVPRSDGQPFEMKVEPRRDARFSDSYNSTANFDHYYFDENRPADERTYALLFKRLREMDVPEWMGPIIYKTTGKPWDYYQDLSRQLWDEARHSMMGEVGLYQDAVAFYKYPVEFLTTMALNKTATPLEAHLVLWYIEQGLMPKDTGKHFEWAVAKESDNELAKTFQDYDWADEVLHAQIGRKWLVSEFKDMGELKQQAESVMNRNLAEKVRLSQRSEQQEWWPDFLAEIRAGKERTRGGVTAS
ncbi:hypothetical protein A8709_14030 [Paenibacillus pectinilyticus]|uniref:DUF455 domain-containing protein n=1 Tax=Paenibacillus pectinilyticus TaxID=512399 RepID=A0A1C1A3V0_9BACL|nr:hypothetical protein [Paenibacillus pectinilyticus]OCT15216.1 hypothetical protein A8709_14030 [Paenibacillus pectinilyticus]